ncbi:hypothetical protein AC579_5650 [Pseudocercospora musae]|uniref:Uncharacterized protein n=1 Tax=Pseudocercospora musae TaxID=113226 RepID=A0A139IC56_9PEZI|nr:hypothetical protein AC579_5650 [Pseudocercospora musae]
MQKTEESKQMAEELQSHRLPVQMAPQYPDVDTECLSLRMWMSSPGAVGYLLSPRDKKQLEKELRCHRAWKNAMHDVRKTFFVEENFPEFFPPEGQRVLDVATEMTQQRKQVTKTYSELMVSRTSKVSGWRIGYSLGAPLVTSREACDLHNAPNGEISTIATGNHAVYPICLDLVLAICGRGKEARTQDVDSPEDSMQRVHSEEFSTSNGEANTAFKEHHEGTSETNREWDSDQTLVSSGLSYENIFNAIHSLWNWNLCTPQTSDLAQLFFPQGEQPSIEDVDEPNDPHNDHLSEPLNSTFHG